MYSSRRSMYIPTYMLLRQFKLTGGWLRWHFKRKNLWWSWRKSTYAPDYQRESNFTVSEWHCSRPVFANARRSFDKFSIWQFLPFTFSFLLLANFLWAHECVQHFKTPPPLLNNKKTKNWTGDGRQSELDVGAKESSFRKEKSSSRHHAVLCILFPMNITVDLTLLVSLKWSPCDLLWSLITYRDVSSFSLVYPLLGGWLLGLGVCVCCAASACIHADVCSIITSSLAVKFIIVLKSERVCVCGANRSVPKPIMFKGDGAGIYRRRARQTF
jgi:hypothetical protein